MFFACAFGGFDSLGQDRNDDNQQTNLDYFNETELQVESQIEIYPNPVVEYLHVRIDRSELVNLTFEMHSLIGNDVQIEVEEIGGNAFRIPVENFANGYYFIVIKDDVTRFNKAFKFLKKD